MSQSSPIKRSITEDVLLEQNSANQAPRNGIDPELAALLRNTARRARKNVMEGYATSSAMVPQASDLSLRALPFTQSASFISARDSYQHALSSTPSTSCVDACSSKKRKHVSPQEGDEENLEEDLDMFDAPRRLNDHPLSDVRPMKPLRKARQRMTATQSMPAGVFRFSTAEREGKGAIYDTEEDWSLEL